MHVALLVAVLALASCTNAPQCKLDTLPGKAAGPAFLWRVSKGADVLWLYGTIHDAGLDAVPQPALDALDGASRLITELGATKPDPDRFRKHARVERGLGIDQRLASDDWYDLRDALRGVIEEDDLRRAAPWYAMTLLTTHLGPKPGPSMDTLLGERAESRGLEVVALETWDEQLAMLDAVVKLENLTEAIRTRHTMRCDLQAMLAAYKAGDTDRMTAYLVVPRTAETMLFARNRAWMPTLEGYAGNGGAFVAVGLGHMLGEHGLPVLFERAGYTVERR